MTCFRNAVEISTSSLALLVPPFGNIEQRAGRQDKLVPALKHGRKNFRKFADPSPYDAPLGVLLRLQGGNRKRIEIIGL